jgi:hypothetical protein
MSDKDAVSVAIALTVCARAKKRGETELLNVRQFFLELSILYISFLKFVRRELNFLVKSSL